MFGTEAIVASTLPGQSTINAATKKAPALPRLKAEAMPRLAFRLFSPAHTKIARHVPRRFARGSNKPLECKEAFQ